MSIPFSGRRSLADTSSMGTVGWNGNPLVGPSVPRETYHPASPVPASSPALPANPLETLERIYQDAEAARKRDDRILALRLFEQIIAANEDTEPPPVHVALALHRSAEMMDKDGSRQQAADRFRRAASAWDALEERFRSTGHLDRVRQAAAQADRARTGADAAEKRADEVRTRAHSLRVREGALHMGQWTRMGRA